MKRLTNKIIIAVCTFVIGISAALIWFSASLPNASLIPPLDRESTVQFASLPETTIYSVNLCELVQNPERYNGKIINTQGIYEQTVDMSALTDSACNARLIPSTPSEKSFWKTMNQLNKVLQSSRANKAQVDVVGRFTCQGSSIDNSYPFHQRCNQLLEIFELKGTSRTVK